MSFEEIMEQYQNFMYKQFNSYKDYYQFKHQQEELESLILYALWKSYYHYDYERNNKVTFLSYAWVVVRNEIFMFMRNYKDQELSLYTPVSTDSELNQLTYEDILADPVDLETMITNKFLLIEILNECTEKEKDLLRVTIKMPGYTENTISTKYKVSRSYVSRLKKNTLRKIKIKYIKKGID